MTKQAWIKHIEEETGESLYDSNNPLYDAFAWRGAIEQHKAECPNCQICKARRKTIKANKARKARDEAMKSIGMIKVKGNNGGTYWE
jgi:hypothetical protein